MTVGATGGLVILAIVVVFFAVLYFALRRMTQRHEADAAAVSAWATDHGYTYAETDDEGWTGRWHFAPFGQGRNFHAKHVVSGKYGDADFASFDYTYEVPTGQNQRNTYHFAVITVTLPQPVPWFDVRHRQHHVIPHGDANAVDTGDKAFEENFATHSETPDYAVAALTPQLKAMLVDQHLQGIHVVDGRLFGWKDQTHHKVATLPGRLSALAAAATALPTA